MINKNTEVLRVSIDDTVKLSIHELATTYMRNQSLERTQEIYDAVCKMFIDHYGSHIHIFSIDDIIHDAEGEISDFITDDITYDIDDNEDETLMANYQAIETLKNKQ